MKKIMYIVLGMVVLGATFILGRQSVLKDDVAIDLYQSGEIELLNLSDEEGLDETKINRFFELKEALLEAHDVLVLKRTTFQASRETLQGVRETFREEKIRVSYEDGITLWTNYHEILDIKDAFLETEGQAYQRLQDLKGSYNVENIDLIIQTFEEVLTVLETRALLFDQGILLLEESIVVYQTYLA